jgi:hypothetical protein
LTSCIAIKPNGELCQGVATRGSDWCPAHDPARKEARRRSASKAARSKKPDREVADVKDQVLALISDVREGKMDRADAIAIGQLCNVFLRAVSVGLKVKEAEEFAQRLAALEEFYERDQARQERGGW